MAGRGFRIVPSEIHEHANRTAQRGERLSDTGSRVDGAGLHGSALGMVGGSSVSAQQRLTSTLRSAASNAGTRLREHSDLLHGNANSSSQTDEEHAGRLRGIHDDAQTRTPHGGSGTASGRPTKRPRPDTTFDQPNKRPRPESYVPPGSGMAARYRPNSRPHVTRPTQGPRPGSMYLPPSRYRPGAVYRPGYGTYRPPLSPHPAAAQQPVAPPRPPGSVVSLQSFTGPDGQINQMAAHQYMSQYYPQIAGVNQANHIWGGHDYQYNCANVVAATHNSIATGQTHAAGPMSSGIPHTQMEQAAGSTYQPVSSYNELTQHLQHQPPGSQGSVAIMHANNEGHFFNWHKADDGSINYIDGQDGLPADLGTNPTDIGFLRHN